MVQGQSDTAIQLSYITQWYYVLLLQHLSHNLICTELHSATWTHPDTSQLPWESACTPAWNSALLTCPLSAIQAPPSFKSWMTISRNHLWLDDWQLFLNHSFCNSIYIIHCLPRDYIDRESNIFTPLRNHTETTTEEKLGGLYYLALSNQILKRSNVTHSKGMEDKISLWDRKKAELIWVEI